MEGAVVVVGGTSGLGREIATHYAKTGHEVVISGRDQARAEAVAAEIGGNTRGIALDLHDISGIGAALAGVGQVEHLVIAAIDRDNNKIREYDIEGAIKLAGLKLVGYAEVIHSLLDRLGADSSIVLFGGLAKDRPYPGSLTVTTVNGGISTMINSLVIDLAPIRINAIHPGIVGDSPYWADRNLEGVKARTPGGELSSMEDVVGAVVFLLENRGVNGVNLPVDRGWRVT
jgi:NAD(P)-dependent dehydrogenase (short-subunit alcohol dehydrogenase family)